MLLTCVAALACFMPSQSDEPLVTYISRAEFLALRRGLVSRAVQMFDDQTSSDSKVSIDYAMASFMLTMIGPSDSSVHASVPRWVAMLKFTMQKLQLAMAYQNLHGEEAEEWAR
jgi:hypothetical protein